MSLRGTVLIEVVRGKFGGVCLTIGNDSSGYRLAGPKPSGGGTTIHRFEVSIEELRRELDAITGVKS